MRLERVTITGIDDQVDLGWLDELTFAFPFVEWGVLLSDGRKGKPRYPTDEWVARLTDMFMPRYDNNFSAHLCGDLCDRLIGDAGQSYLRGELVPQSRPGFFSRIQLNSFADNPKWEFHHINLLASNLDGNSEIIVPITDEQAMYRVRQAFHANVNFLHDPSRGQGVPTENWSNPHTEHFVGFAGGIGPHNVRDVIEMLNARDDDRWYWIDMETNVRTDDQLDPMKVEEILKIAASFVSST